MTVAEASKRALETFIDQSCAEDRQVWGQCYKKSGVGSQKSEYNITILSAIDYNAENTKQFYLNCDARAIKYAALIPSSSKTFHFGTDNWQLRSLPHYKLDIQSL